MNILYIFCMEGEDIYTWIFCKYSIKHADFYACIIFCMEREEHIELF